ncbi:hypothetical protein Tco_0760074, partial [Tanacetum coccineum]
NMGFNESEEYKKTFISSGVGTGSMQVLHEFEFEVEPLEDHTFEVEPRDNVDQGVGLQEVQTQDLMDYQLARDRKQHLACELFGYREDNNEAAFSVAAVEKIYAHELLTFNNTVACEVISKWKAGLKYDMDARSDMYVLKNGCRKCSDDSDGYYWEYTPGMFIHLFLYIDDMVFSCGCKAEIWVTKGLLVQVKGNILGLEIIKDQSGNTLRVSQSRIHKEKLVQTLLKGHSTLSLEDSLLGDCDVEKNGNWSYIYMRLEARSSQSWFFDDFDYAMGRSITVMSRSITGYGLMILGCARSLNANLQHMEALSTIKAGYMTFTEAWKKKIWLKGLLTES